ncbi:MarR family transcriptional regulator [Capsulimonas corticalis]|uniref:MarR family transcriptional regulator n=1 Tax=Capsulimonas corticalis TaxID=2219043 RepID=A0A402CSH0_9BACT|nr:MarR family transcriptional regulator [Capsulimonas corticalis]BDI31095.1 MarR family transcriptional regulator [Capsulimonas corticalis]
MKKDREQQLSDADGAAFQEQSTAFLLTQVGTQVGIRFGERLFPHGLTPPQVGILLILAREDGVNQRSLADRLGVVPSRLVVLVDELERAGLIARGANAPDRRSHSITLTAAGRAMTETLDTLVIEHDAALLAALSPEEKSQLRTLLGKIAAQEGLSPGVHPGYRFMGRRAKEL